MTRPFTANQSSEVDDRIVEMIVAVFGEGEISRRCRIIANERYLDFETAEAADSAIMPEVLAMASGRESAAEISPAMRQVIAAARYAPDPADRFRRLPRTDDEIAHELSRVADALRSRQQNSRSAGGVN